MNVNTYGDLMDMANDTANDTAKSLLRESFQKYCRDNGLVPMDPSTVSKWRNSVIAENEVGTLIMTAFGL